MEQGYKLRSMGRALGFLLLFITLAGTLWGQSAANYTYTTATNSSLEDMSSGTTEIFSVGTYRDDIASSLYDIGFNFVYFGQVYTQFSINSNGQLRLGSTVIAGGAQSPASGVMLLAPISGDNAIRATGKAHYKVTGSAPNRVLVVEWTDVRIPYSSAAETGTYCNFQALIHESSGKVEYRYGSMYNMGTSASTRTVFFSAGNTSGLIGQITDIIATLTYSTSSSSLTNTSFPLSSAMTNLDGTSDGNRRIFNFEPGAAATAPTDLSFSDVGVGSMILNWNDSPDELRYAIFNSTDGTNYTLVNGSVAQNSTSFAATGLNPGTTYYWRVYALSEGKLGTPLSGTQATNSPTFSGTKSIGPTGDYTTLTAAIAAATASGLSGAAILELQSTFTGGGETFPITIGNIAGTSSINTLTIRPATGSVGLILTGSNATAILDLNGARYVIVDGRPGGIGDGQQLAFQNTNTSGAAVRFINDASNNTLRNLNLEGVSTSTTMGVVFFSSVNVTTGNDNNLITYCNIRDVATTPVHGVYAAHSASYPNDNNTISYCNIFNFFLASGQSSGVLVTGGDNWIISNNSFYQTASRSFSSTSGLYRVISIENTSSIGNTISGNYIGGTQASAGGTAWTQSGSGNNFIGIRMSCGTTTPSSLQGNTIANISISTSTTSSVSSGISVTSGSVNIGTVTGNTIGDMSNTGSITWSGTGSGALFTGINFSSTSVAVISNNNLGGITITGSGTTLLRGIWVSSGTSGNYQTVTNNTVGGTIANSLSNSTNNDNYGIHTSSTTPRYTIQNNTVRNITHTSTSTSGEVWGIYSQGALSDIIGNTVHTLSTTTTSSTLQLIGITISNTSSNQNNVSGNTVYSLTQANSGSGTTHHVYGIYQNVGTVTPSTVQKNLVHSLKLSTSGSAATTQIRGIQVNAGAVNLINNMIRIGVDAEGNPISGSYYIQGIIIPSTGACSLYHNSVYVGGTSVSGTQPTHAFLRSGTSGTHDLQNNIFVNERSNGTGTGKHYAIVTNGTTTVTSNYNLLRVTGTGGITGSSDNGATDRLTLADWQSNTTFDANSIAGNPLFVNTTGTAAQVDLHVQVGTPIESAGTLIATVTDDFDSQSRVDLSPVDIGADAGLFGTDFVSWANLQSPPTASVKEGVGVLVYAQVYVAGVTEPAGQGAGITGWIGYSTDNTNPNTWTNWVPATFNVQSGNNDEYMAKIGATLPAGTYYYASRFKYNTSSYYFGGYNGGAWNGTTNVSGVLTITDNTVGWSNLQFPGTATIQETQSVNVYGRVWIDEVTLSSDTTAAITAWIGVNSANTDPSTWTEGSWKRAFFNAHAGNNDEYIASIGNNLAPGTYYYATRYQLINDSYVYGGYSTDGGNFWDGITNVNGMLTVSPFTLTSFPYFEGFEGGTVPPQAWSNTGTKLWSRGTEVKSGTYSARAPYSPSGSAILNTFAIQLPADMRISFWWKDDDITSGRNITNNGELSLSNSKPNNPEIAGYDTTYFEISTDNTVWTSLAYLSAAAFQTSYVQQIIDLSPYGNQTVYLRWRDVSDGSFSAYGTGLDDITIEKNPSATNSSTIPATSTDPVAFGTTGTTIQFTVANTGDLNLTVDKIGSNPGGTPPGSLQNIAPQYWSITVTSGTVNGTYSITLDITGVPGVNNPATLHLLKRDNASGTWTDLGVANSISGNLLTWTGLTSFSEFGIGSNNDNPLPVQLSAFNVTTEARNALLSWETATEENAFKFVIEKKNIDAATWSVAGEVKASGNSNSPKKYNYTDQKLNSGKYSYRLKMIDNDGTFTYSDVVEVDISVPKDYAVSQNYPNPFNPTTKIDYQLPFDSRVQIELYNITGERVATLVNMDQKAGYYTFDFTNTSHLSSGVYIYRIIATGAAQDKPFTAVKKMVMMK